MVSVAQRVFEALQTLEFQVYPGELPTAERGDEDARFPCIVYRQIGGGPGLAQDGPTGCESPIWECVCWAVTYTDAKAMGYTVSNLLLSLGMTVTEHDDREPHTGRWRNIVTGHGTFTTGD